MERALDTIRQRQIVTIQGLIKKENNTFNRFSESLHSITSNDYQLNTNSLGGDQREAAKIIDKMVSINSPICAVAHGQHYVGSSTLYIFVNGVYRTCEAYTGFHIHRHRDAQTGLIPKDITREEIMFWRILALRTNTHIGEFIQMARTNSGEGTWFDADKARTLGIVHEVCY